MAAVGVDVGDWLRLYGGDRVSLGRVLCDDHPDDMVALTYNGAGGVERVTFGELGERSKRLAGALRDTGIAEGDRVAVMLPKSVELVVAMLAILRAGAVHVPLFTAFGPDAATYRILHSGARCVITDADNRGKIEIDNVPVMRVGEGHPQHDIEFAEAVELGPRLEGVVRGGDDLMLLLYTSGTTGQPKGVEVPVRALASFHAYMRYGLDVRDEDVFWNVSDPGWAYGLWYGIIGSLLLGRGSLLWGKPFDAEAAFTAMIRHGVTNLAGSPTAFRALRAAGVPEGFAEAAGLRAISSAGEPLNAELIEWSTRELGAPIHDHYGQSELGMVAGFAQHPELHIEPVPGSMGVALPGFRVVVVDGEGRKLEAGAEGELAIDADASPLYWFRGYFADSDRTAERFRHGPRFYLTADSASVDHAGLIRFSGRADEVITSSGYRIGPFEVESALIAHPAVAEAAVVGTPDDFRGEAVTAFVVTGPGVDPGDELAAELQQFVKEHLAKHLSPRRLYFLESLPRTPSGKVKRAALREQWRTGGSGT